MTPTLPPPASVPRPPARAHPPLRSGSALALAWLRGSLHAARFDRQELIASWSSPAAVCTLEAFGPALDAARTELGFGGTEIVLLLEHEAFIHRIEVAPSSSPAAARSYLHARVAREGSGGAVWCAQPMAATRQDATFILHALPTAFWEQLQGILRPRQLELARIFPLSVALQLELDAVAGNDQPILLAAGTDEATTIVVGWAGGRLALARTFFASWCDEPGRVGGEINRSLLYAKQQLGTAVDRIRLFGPEPVEAEVRSRCGEGKEIEAGPADALPWLRAIASLPPGHPGNLLGDRRRQNRRRQLIRGAVAAAGWLGLAWLALAVGNGLAAGRAEQRRFSAVQLEAATLQAESGRLAARNRVGAEDHELLQENEAHRLPPVPARFLAYLGTVLPTDIRLTDFQVEQGRPPVPWSFRISGTLGREGESARDRLAAFQQALEQGPWHAHVSDAPAPPGPAAAGESNFHLEGTLLEN
jgi:hypothetical protein